VNKVKLEITSLATSLSNASSHALQLTEVGGHRRFVIVISTNDANVINLEMSHISSPRPLTQDLLKTVMDEFDITVKEVLIYKLNVGIYYAHIIAERSGIEVEFDSRPSDAIVMALKFEADIYIDETVLNSVALDFSGNQASSKKDTNKPNEVRETGVQEKKPVFEPVALTIAEIEEALAKALENEDYEKAAKLRDELQKRGV
jgi:bifunctional DNase/RNase